VVAELVTSGVVEASDETTDVVGSTVEGCGDADSESLCSDGTVVIDASAEVVGVEGAGPWVGESAPDSDGADDVATVGVSIADSDSDGEGDADDDRVFVFEEVRDGVRVIVRVAVGVRGDGVGLALGSAADGVGVDVPEAVGVTDCDCD
jgi:hypothetical protein